MQPVKLIAGLGNPGEAYSLTRHNIGFSALDHIARETGAALNRRDKGCLFGCGTLCGRDIILAKPQTFMNLSGTAVKALCGALAIDAGDIIVIHDDMDLPFGTLKIKTGGGSAGHRGIQSLISLLATDAFTRLRMGIGRPPDALPGADFVLEPFTAGERQQLDAFGAQAFRCLETLLTSGVQAAMNRFHGAALQPDSIADTEKQRRQ